MKKVRFIILVIFSFFQCVTLQAQYMSASQIYKYAKSRNYRALSQLRNYLEMQDNSGNTALCLAVIDDDYQTYNLLRQYGANSQPYCLQSAIAASGSSTFLGMGTTGWLTTGAIVAAGAGVAVAAGGGGGGGGSSDSSSSNDSTTPITCVNGSISNGQCQCNDGWTGDTCNTAQTCSYNTTSCTSGYEETGNTCKSGNITYKECRAKTVPDGYTKNPCGNGYTQVATFLSGTDTYYKCITNECAEYVTSCGNGYHATSDTCLSGSKTMYKCEINDCSAYQTSCGEGYTATQSCLSGTTPYYTCTPKDIPAGYTSTPCSEGYYTKDTFLSGTTPYYLCEANICSGYDYTTCPSGYESSSTCLSGDTTKHKCVPATCMGYDYTTCPSGYTQSDTCQSGENLMLKCENCAEEFIQYQGVCYPDQHCGKNMVQIQNECVCNDGYEDINGVCQYVGLYNETTNNKELVIENSDEIDIHGMYKASELYNAKNGTATIDITNLSNGNVYGMSGDNAYNAYNQKSTDTTKGTINITNIGDGDIYGIRGNYSTNAYGYATGKAVGIINIINQGNGNVYGMHSFSRYNAYERASGTISIDNQGNGDVYGMYTGTNAYKSFSEGIINIKNRGTGNSYGMRGGINSYGGTGYIIMLSYDGNAYGMYGISSYLYNAKADPSIRTSKGTISLTGAGCGDIYGMYSDISASIYMYNAYEGTSGEIVLHSQKESTGNVYGMYAMGDIYNAYNTSSDTTASGNIKITNQGSGNAYGMYGKNVYNITDNSTRGTINISNYGDGLAVGIYSKNGTVVNSGEIKLLNEGDGTAIGIYADGSATVSNSGEITVYSRNDKDGVAIGIYGTKGSTIINETTGKIKINDNIETSYGIAKTAYGIYSEGSNVINKGEIKINNHLCGLSSCTSDNNAIILNGGSLLQNGKMSASSLNLNDFGGKIVASDTSKFIVEGAISGDLAINNSVVENGFDTTYSVKNMIQAEGTSGLNLQSQSALFDATLKNNTDAVMTMKAFNDVVENKSLADFLEQNYAAQNNEQLFSILKGKETLSALNDTLDSLTGSDMFNRFTFEDLTMMRDLNADMNSTLFLNTKDHLETAGNITPWNFDGNSGSNARYALYNTTFGRKSLGLGFAFSDVRSNNGRNNKDSRYDQTFQMSVPMGYKVKGFKFITTPRFGYANGTYDRTGYEGKNYNGKIEKRIFGLMNEARYPITFGKWNIAPTIEFNALGYHIKGKEDEKEYSLNIKSQNNCSVESGIGLHTNYELKPTKNSTLKFNAGAMVYHEFADPYELDLQMKGMDGSFKIRDKHRKDNRAVLRTGFNYEFGKNLTLTGALATYLDGITHNNANLDFKYNF